MDLPHLFKPSYYFKHITHSKGLEPGGLVTQCLGIQGIASVMFHPWWTCTQGRSQAIKGTHIQPSAGPLFACHAQFCLELLYVGVRNLRLTRPPVPTAHPSQFRELPSACSIPLPSPVWLTNASLDFLHLTENICLPWTLDIPPDSAL